MSLIFKENLAFDFQGHSAFDQSGNITNVLEITGTTLGVDNGIGKGGALFDGTTSLVDATTNFIGTKACIIEFWITPYGWGEGSSTGRILNVGGGVFLYISLGYAGTRTVVFSSNGGVVSTVAAETGAVALNTPVHGIAYRKLDGKASIYINGELSGTADRDSGTPEVGFSNVLIGNTGTYHRTFDGLINRVQVWTNSSDFSDALIPAFVEQRYDIYIDSLASVSTQQTLSDSLYDIKLYPRNSDDDPFTSGRMTIKLDHTGNPETFSGNLALEQDVLKAAFTNLKNDGYGSVIRSLIGSKNAQIVKAMLTYSLLSTYKLLAIIHKKLSSEKPTQFRGDRVLSSMEVIKVDTVSPTKTRIRVNFLTQNNQLQTTDTVFRQERG